MKIRILETAGVLALGVSSALAGEPATADDPYASPNWSGFYVGGNLGGSWGDVGQSQIAKIDGTLITPHNNFGSGAGEGFAGGAQLGYDYQMGRWVLGVQGAYDSVDIQETHALPAFPTFSAVDDVKYAATLAARVGYLLAPETLVYMKGGGAWTKVDASVIGTGASPFLSESTSYDTSGWIIGAGLEWSFSPGWSVFAELDYLDFGTNNVSYVQGPATVGIADVVATDLTISQALFGVNFRF